MKGIIQVTGETGVGKTSFALGTPGVKPEHIAVINLDVKEYPPFPFGFKQNYMHILQKTDGKPEINLAQAVLNDIEKIKSMKDIRVVVLDSWEIFSKAFTVYFLAHANEYKHVIGGGAIAQMSRLGHASKVEVALLDSLIQSGVETVFVVNHLRDEYDSPAGGDTGVKTGRKIPEASARLEQKAAARFWLKHNPDHTCPIAVVLKDPGSFTWDNGLRADKMFPERLSPIALGEENIRNATVSIWDVIEHYKQNPVRSRILHGFEKMTPEEFAYVAGTLTPMQRAALEQNQRLALMFGNNYNDELIERIKSLKDKGFVGAYQELKDEFPELTLAQVKETLG